MVSFDLSMKRIVAQFLVLGLIVVSPWQIADLLAQRAFPSGSGEMMLLNQQRYPWLIEANRQSEISIRERIASMSSPANGRPAVNPDTIYLPYVVHVIHNNGQENVSDDFIIRKMDSLERAFRDTAGINRLVRPLFRGVIDHPNIVLRRARIDPRGNCTNGIDRVLSPQTANANDETKLLAYWPTNQYLNIYVVQNISLPQSVITPEGYAYRPSQIPPSPVGLPNGVYDGVMVRANTSAINWIHEVGTYCDLIDVFGPSFGVQDCTGNDQVQDTPPTRGNIGTCLPWAGQCIDTIIPMTENYMDLGTCRFMFTAGQAVRMRASFRGTNAPRASLVTRENLYATGTFPTQNPSACAPRAAIDVAATSICINSQLTLRGNLNFAANATNIRYRWTLVDATATPDTGRVINARFTAPGLKTIGLTILFTLPTGESQATTTLERWVNVIDTTGANVRDTMPYNIDFNEPDFFNQVLTGSRAFSFGNDSVTFGGNPFELTPNGFQLSQGIRIKRAEDGTQLARKYWFETPLIETRNRITGITTPYLYLRYAAVPNVGTQQANDVLNVYASSNCGRGYALVASLNRNTNPEIYNLNITSGNPFLPRNREEWKLLTLRIPSGFFTTRNRFKVEVVSTLGNFIYFDDFQLSGGQIILSAEERQTMLKQPLVLPNPASDQSVFVFNALQTGDYPVQILDRSGKVLAQQTLQISEMGSQQIPLHMIAGQLPAGMYLIRLYQGNGSTSTTRFVVR